MEDVVLTETPVRHVEGRGVCKSGRPWKDSRPRATSVLKKPFKSYEERKADKDAQEVCGPHTQTHTRTHLSRTHAQVSSRAIQGRTRHVILILQAVKRLESELKSDRADERRKANEKRRLKQERKKENTIRHAIAHQGVQLIKDTTKVKKMSLKLRKKLVKVPIEMLTQMGK